MSEPKRPGTYVGHGTFVGYLCGEADAYMDALEAELTQLRTERDDWKRVADEAIAMLKEATNEQ